VRNEHSSGLGKKSSSARRTSTVFTFQNLTFLLPLLCCWAKQQINKKAPYTVQWRHKYPLPMNMPLYGKFFISVTTWFNCDVIALLTTTYRTLHNVELEGSGIWRDVVWCTSDCYLHIWKSSAVTDKKCDTVPNIEKLTVRPNNWLVQHWRSLKIVTDQPSHGWLDSASHVAQSSASTPTQKYHIPPLPTV